MHHVYSTLTNDNVYTKWEKGGGDLNVLHANNKVLIKGGTGVANKRLVTPLGVHTMINDDQLAICENDPVFRMHKDNGFIKVSKSNTNPEKVAADMVTRDASAPLVQQDFEDGNDGRLMTGLIDHKLKH